MLYSRAKFVKPFYFGFDFLNLKYDFFYQIWVLVDVIYEDDLSQLSVERHYSGLFRMIKCVYVWATFPIGYRNETTF